MKALGSDVWDPVLTAPTEGPWAGSKMPSPQLPCPYGEDADGAPSPPKVVLLSNEMGHTRTRSSWEGSSRLAVGPLRSGAPRGWALSPLPSSPLLSLTGRPLQASDV